jgi:hypothetical protein
VPQWPPPLQLGTIHWSVGQAAPDICPLEGTRANESPPVRGLTETSFGDLSQPDNDINRSSIPGVRGASHMQDLHAFRKSNMSNGNGKTTQPIYRWNGKYFGFVSDGYLLDAAGAYRGWIDGNGTVWQANGKFLGNLVGGEYVLLQQSTKHENQPKRFSPSPVTLPPRPEDKPARSPRAGYVDGLDACE